MYLGEFQRLYLVMNRAMKRANALASWSTPQKAFSASLPISRPKPVPGMSMKTRSLASSRRIGVVHQPVRRGRHVLVAAGHHVLGAQRAHVQPHRRAARAAVIKERHRPVLGLGSPF